MAEPRPAVNMDSMPEIHAVAVFCGSRTGKDPAYRAAAQTLGHGLAEAGIRLVYGGGRIGLMGVMADAALAAGGKDEGAVGPRSWHPHAYGAYVRDLDGNKLATYCLKPE